jgi:hypothetical protein
LLELEALYVTGTSLLVTTEFVEKSHCVGVPFMPELFLLQERVIADNKMTNTQSFKKLYFLIKIGLVIKPVIAQYRACSLLSNFLNKPDSSHVSICGGSITTFQDSHV